jgi:NTP pyrophosphatase (non-canonical NTP hydrolase)
VNLENIQIVEAQDTPRYFPSVDASVDYLAIALAGEVGEACNVVKKWLRGDFETNEFREFLYQELPDVLIYLVLLAEAAGFSLQDAYVDKKEYNNVRYGNNSTAK